MVNESQRYYNCGIEYGTLIVIGKIICSSNLHEEEQKRQTDIS